MKTHDKRFSFGMGRLSSIAQYRGIFREFIVRDLKLRYEGASLGYLWTLIEPLLLTAVYFVVFGIIGRFDTIDDYILFLILGMLPWLWFQGSITAGTKSIRNRAGILSKVYVPLEIAPLSVIGAKTVEYIASIPIIIAVVILTGHMPTSLILLVPVGWLIQAALMVGLVLALSATNIMVRDIERLLPVMLRFAFYATPLLYPLAAAADRLPSALSWFYWFNPMTGVMEAYRAGFYPDLYQGWQYIAVAAAEALVILLAGWWVFIRLETEVLKDL
jgi:ABC-2 type transport system permease protein